MVRRETLAGGEYPAIKACDIERMMSETIVPYLDSRAEAFSIPRPHGAATGSFFRADAPKGTVVISHGFTETGKKYRELIYYWLNEGFNVCAPDHRGHGLSREEFGVPTDIDSFQTYIDDFAAVVDSLVKPLPGSKIVFAHSMGGLIAAGYMEQHPGVFTKAVLSSPLFELNRGKMSYFAAAAMLESICLFGMGKKYLPGQRPYSGKEGFEGSPSVCRERYMLYYLLQKQDKTLQNGGSSRRWARSALRMCAKVLRKKNCARVTIPVLLFQAETDTYVLPKGQERFISSIPDGRIVFVPGSKHEIYLSGDDIMPRYLKTIFDFIS